MQLVRITERTVDQAASASGTPEMLAALLGGEGGAETPAFPATLQAILSAGGATGETGEVLEGEGAAAGESDASGDDETGTSLDAALAVLAAALDLGVVTPTSPAPAPEAASDAAVAIDGGAAKSLWEGIEAGAVVEGSPSGGGDLAPTSATTAVEDMVGSRGSVVAPESAAKVTEQPPGVTTATTATAEVTPPPTASPRVTPPTIGDDGRPVPQLRVAGPGTEALPIQLAGTAAPAEAVTAGRPTPNGAHGGSAEPVHHGVGDVAIASTKTAFSSGGSEQQALDLGTSDRQAFALVGKSATALTTATAPGYAGEQIHATSAATGGGAGDATTALPPVTTPSAPQDGATPRIQLAAQHPSGIDARWGERVADALRLSAVRGGGEIRLQLEPEGLGHIDVRLHLQPDGVRAVIVAEHESTRALLTSQQHVLQEAFNRSDLRLSGFSVDVGSGGGAATFGRDGEAGERGSAPPSAAALAASQTSTEVLDSAAAPLANGRLSVRV